MVNKIKLFTARHWLALGVLIGVSVMTSAIWYAVPGRAQSSGQPIDLPVTASGWQFSHGPGGGAGPNGVNGCYAGYVAKCFQDLGKSPADFQEYRPGYTNTGFYTVTFFAVNFFPSYPAYYTVELNYGTQELCSTDGWASNIATRITLVCPSPGYLIVDRQLPNQDPPQGQNHLVLSFTVSYWQALSDNYSVTFTPQ